MNINATLLGHVIWFGFFIWLTMKFIWPPLQKAMHDRQKQIADGLAAAERGKQDLELAAKRSAEVLQEARNQAADILGQAEKRGAQANALWSPPKPRSSRNSIAPRNNYAPKWRYWP